MFYRCPVVPESVTRRVRPLDDLSSPLRLESAGLHHPSQILGCLLGTMADAAVADCARLDTDHPHRFRSRQPKNPALTGYLAGHSSQQYRMGSKLQDEEPLTSRLF